ncbi:hypothetical protein [Pseudonocardia nigra]|uniref:hypothetical protein n=1 Tax=Pseudonocardia nigra TaxID=1921578 RepID=UPI001FEB4F34|nr:hypothetical protein [Pseudonocardia nigra]
MGLATAAYAVLLAVVIIESAVGWSPLAAPAIPTATSAAALAVLVACGTVALAGVRREPVGPRP